MRWKAALCAGLVAPLAGCNLAYYAGHNLTNEVVSRLDERKLDRRLRSEARAAWREVGQQYQVGDRCPEFEDGFCDGYIDYLQHGGVPRPPVVPPLKYRRSRYLSPEGQAQVKEYFHGFQYGAEVAAASGKREYLTVPLLLPAPPPAIPLNITRTPVLPVPPDVAPLAPGVPLPELRPLTSRPKPDPRPLTEPIAAPPPARPTPVEVPKAAPKAEPLEPTPVRVAPPMESAPTERMPETLPPVPGPPPSVPPVPDPMPPEKG